MYFFRNTFALKFSQKLENEKLFLLLGSLNINNDTHFFGFYLTKPVLKISRRVEELLLNRFWKSNCWNSLYNITVIVTIFLYIIWVSVGDNISKLSLNQLFQNRCCKMIPEHCLHQIFRTVFVTIFQKSIRISYLGNSLGKVFRYNFLYFGTDFVTIFQNGVSISYFVAVLANIFRNNCRNGRFGTIFGTIFQNSNWFNYFGTVFLTYFKTVIWWLISEQFL